MKAFTSIYGEINWVKIIQFLIEAYENDLDGLVKALSREIGADREFEKDIYNYLWCHDSFKVQNRWDLSTIICLANNIEAYLLRKKVEEKRRNKMTKVLVIDDDIGSKFNVYHKDFLKMYGSIEGFEFVFCDGRSNLDPEAPFEVQYVLDFISKNQDVNVVLLDKNFGANHQFGIVVLKKLKNLCVNIPVLMFTSETDKKIIEECLSGGAIGFLKKDPWLSAKDFKDEIKKFCK